MNEQNKQQSYKLPSLELSQRVRTEIDKNSMSPTYVKMISSARIPNIKQLTNHINDEKNEFFQQHNRKPLKNISRSPNQFSMAQQRVYGEEQNVKQIQLSQQQRLAKLKNLSELTEKLHKIENKDNDLINVLKEIGIKDLITKSAVIQKASNPEINDSEGNADLKNGINSGNSNNLSFIKAIKEQGTYFESLPAHIKLYFQHKRDFQRTFQDVDVVNYCLNQVNERVRCYRYELGNLMENISEKYFYIITCLLENFIRYQDEIQKRFEKQIQENLNVIERFEREKKEMEQINRDLKNRYVVQESLFKITKINSDAMQNELIMLHELLQTDIMNMINHLGNLENSQAQKQNQSKKDEPQQHLVKGLDQLNKVIQNLESEHGSKENMLSTMNGLLKAMLKGSKHDAYTQVDEGELHWDPAMIINFIPGQQAEQILNLEDVEHLTINASNTVNYDKYKVQKNAENMTNKETLLIKEHEMLVQQNKKGNVVGPQSQQLSSQPSDSWQLPISMIIFLENVTKQNETGRVIPWLHFRKVIYEIYNERVKYDTEIQGSQMTTTMTLDEFVCIYFLKTYKLRRLAEIKLFEFLVSLRFYIKQQPRAAMFALFCNITSFPANISNSEPYFNYKFDIYLLNFFLFTFKKFHEDVREFVEDEGVTLMTKQRVIEMIKEVLVFTVDAQRIKLQQKLQKIMQKLDKNKESQQQQQYCDIDRVLDLFVEEYFESKKRVNKNLLKNFQRIFEVENSIISLDDVRQICAETLGQSGLVAGFAYPKDFTVTKVFLYALTSTRNTFDINNKEFFNAIQRFGLDSPFPQLKLINVALSSGNFTLDSQNQSVQQSPPQNQLQPQQQLQQQQVIAAKQPHQDDTDILVNQTLNTTLPDSIVDKKDVAGLIKDLMSHQDFKREDALALLNFFGDENEVIQGKNKGGLKIEAASSLFAQHFSILRDLRVQVRNFKETFLNEQNPEQLIEQFGNIISVLEAGCQFLNFPISI